MPLRYSTCRARLVEGTTHRRVARTDARTGARADDEPDQNAGEDDAGAGASLDVLGFTLRYDRDRRGRDRRYLNVMPSVRAQARLREKLRGLTSAPAKTSLVATIAAVNTLLRGWSTYFRDGYPRRVFRRINHYVQGRFRCFLRNRSQRRSRPFRAGESLYAGLHRDGRRSL